MHHKSKIKSLDVQLFTSGFADWESLPNLGPCWIQNWKLRLQEWNPPVENLANTITLVVSATSNSSVPTKETIPALFNGNQCDPLNANVIFNGSKWFNLEYPLWLPQVFNQGLRQQCTLCTVGAVSYTSAYLFDTLVAGMLPPQGVLSGGFLPQAGSRSLQPSRSASYFGLANVIMDIIIRIIIFIF